MSVTLADVERAQVALKGVAQRTALLFSHTFSRLAGCQVYLKPENLQRTGSFKLRGAYWKLETLRPEQRAHGVVAASAGNHAQGVAVAAAIHGVPATIVMPELAPLAKVTATRSYGAQVILHGESYDDALGLAVELAQSRSQTLIHAFDDPAIIAGQGTVGLEIVEDLPDVDVIVAAVGGGGLISGLAVAARARRPSVRVVGVQAAGAAAAVESFRQGRIVTLPAVQTVADGIAVKHPGELTLALMRECVDHLVTVDDDAIVHAIVLLLERTKLVVEGAGAAGLAALLAGCLPVRREDKVAVVLSGGNIDVNLMARIIYHGLTAAGRYLVLRTRVKDRPGELSKLLRCLAEERVNVLDVEHRRTGINVPVDQAEVLLTLETRDAAHGIEVIDYLQAAGYHVRREP